MGRRFTAAIGSAIFFAAAPTLVAGLVPWLLTRWHAREPLPGGITVRSTGAVVVALGSVVLISAFVRFVIEGLGTPAPVAPTEQLVVGGLYRYVRNPMYLAVVGIVIGQALVLGRPVLLVYTAIIAAAMAAFVRAHEEPTLAARYGDQYERYCHGVPRWRPRTHPWHPSTHRT